MAVHEENFQVYPEALAPGTEVSGWRIRKRLGAGGFGAAYQVESTSRPGEFFALKMARRLVDERVGREIALLMTWAVHTLEHLRSPEAVSFWRKRGGKPGQRYVYKPSDDLYAVGVSAYRMLSGHWPFPPHLDRDALFAAIESLVPPSPSAVNAPPPQARRRRHPAHDGQEAAGSLPLLWRGSRRAGRRADLRRC